MGWELGMPFLQRNPKIFGPKTNILDQIESGEWLWGQMWLLESKIKAQ